MIDAPLVPARPRWRDFAEIARIQQASFRPDLAYKYWMLVVFWFVPGVTVLVTRQGETITGSILADRHHGDIRIMNLAVHPQYRQQGIGRALMQAALDTSPRDSAVLMVQEENTAAQELYRQLGFQRSGYLASYYGNGNAGIEMRLKRN